MLKLTVHGIFSPRQTRPRPRRFDRMMVSAMANLKHAGHKTKTFSIEIIYHLNHPVFLTWFE